MYFQKVKHIIYLYGIPMVVYIIQNKYHRLPHDHLLYHMTITQLSHCIAINTHMNEEYSSDVAHPLTVPNLLVTLCIIVKYVEQLLLTGCFFNGLGKIRMRGKRSPYTHHKRDQCVYTVTTQEEGAGWCSSPKSMDITWL